MSETYFGQAGTSTENTPYTVLQNSEHIKYENGIDYLTHNAETISQNPIGYISDEQALTAKAREIFIERIGKDFIDRVETEYIDVDGIKMKLERKYLYYTVKYNKEYDAWYIVLNFLPEKQRTERNMT